MSISRNHCLNAVAVIVLIGYQMMADVVEAGGVSEISQRRRRNRSRLQVGSRFGFWCFGQDHDDSAERGKMNRRSKSNRGPSAESKAGDHGWSLPYERDGLRR